ncbi:MAG: elongation factor P [Hyphomicrobiales bacterium]|nr:elongation factor P [Hyphomicrobiales bacterium]
MKINANSVRVGNVIEHQGKLWRVAKTQHTMPGKGGAFVQMELKEMMSGTKLNERFRSSEDIEKAHLDQRDMQFLYREGEMLTLMDTESYEQTQVNEELLGDQVVYLQDGMMLMLESHEGKPVGIELPEQVVLEITETEAVVKGQTAANSYKPAVLENGVRTSVPPFIETGEKVVVKTADGSYVERAK